MKPYTTILAAILGLSVLVSTPVSADASCLGTELIMGLQQMIT